MVNDSAQQNNPNESWFWNLTTKWWFFPVFYVSLAVIYTTLALLLSELGFGSHYIGITSPSIIKVLVFFLYVLIFLPHGFFYFVYLLSGGRSGNAAGFWPAWTIFFHLVFLYLMVIVPYWKYKKNIILKWLIISLILFLVLSFAGCSLGVITKSKFMQFG